MKYICTQGSTHHHFINLKAMSITQTYRDQLKSIAEGVDVNMNNLLGMLTPQQVEDVIAQHKHIGWVNPQSDHTQDMKLDALQRDGNRNRWYLCFSDSVSRDGDKPIDTFLLHELEIQDVLAFMQTVENILIPEPNEAV